MTELGSDGPGPRTQPQDWVHAMLFLWCFVTLWVTVPARETEAGGLAVGTGGSERVALQLMSWSASVEPKQWGHFH